MYEDYWGFSQSPFRNAIDESRFRGNPVHEEALARLLYLVEQRRRCGLLSGPAGTGKSLLLDMLAAAARRMQRQVVRVDLHGLDGSDMLWQLAAELGLAPGHSDSPLALWRKIEDHLKGLQLARIHTVLIFDSLDRVLSACTPMLQRLLHLDDGPSCWMTTIVSTRPIGHSAFSDQLSELADLRIELSAMNQQQTCLYVQQAVRSAGANRELFAADALDRLFQQTGGVLRAVNRLCDMSLLAAMSQTRDAVDAAIIDAAAQECQGRSHARLLV